jgi:hypothetical protein
MLDILITGSSFSMICTSCESRINIRYVGQQVDDYCQCYSSDTNLLCVSISFTWKFIFTSVSSLIVLLVYLFKLPLYSERIELMLYIKNGPIETLLL